MNDYVLGRGIRGRKAGRVREKKHTLHEKELHEEDAAPRLPGRQSMSARDDTLAHHAKVCRELDRRPPPADLRGRELQPPQTPAALSRLAGESQHRG